MAHLPSSPLVRALVVGSVLLGGVGGCGAGLSALGVRPGGGEVGVTNVLSAEICRVNVRDETSKQEQLTVLTSPLGPGGHASVKLPYLGGDLSDPPEEVRKRVDEAKAKAVWTFEARGCTSAEEGGPLTGQAERAPTLATVTGVRIDPDSSEAASVTLK